jgi:NAD+ synthase (glutamine-hydrolysing)
MKQIVVAAAVVNQTPLDWDGNQARLVAAIRGARAAGVSVLCLPEMCISGYGCEDAFMGAGVPAEAQRVLFELLPETVGMVVTFGVPLLYHNALFNTAAVVIDGQIVGFAAKRFLAGDGIHYEPRWFKPWKEGQRSSIQLNGVSYPLGDLMFDVGGVKLGFEICEDAWVAARPGAALAKAGVDIILNPSASHFAFGKFETRKRFVIEGSRAFGVSYVYANLLGNESGRVIYDGGALIASGGRLLAAGPRLGLDDWHLTSAVVDVEATRMAQARTASFYPDIDEGRDAWVRSPFAWPAQPVRPHSESVSAWEVSPALKEEEFTRAVTLALFDYLRKSRSSGFVVSLSGGADSAAVSCLVAMMVRRGILELGLEGFRGKLAYIRALADKDGATMVGELLTTVYQASANSSTVTRAAAACVASALGSRHLELDIEPLVTSYVAMIEKAMGRTLSWEQDDLALQNIQARVRAPGVWMLANLRGALLLATSNRSEAALGYATMDGDTCGGISPIGGIDKAFLRHWLEWLETTGPEGLGPMPALAVVTKQQSTPELRPQDSDQSSESDLMPFPVLDVIERLAIRDKLVPRDVLSDLAGRFPQYPVALLGQWVERFFVLFSRNQWKRERYAPSFHLDDENLDPKTWCRFPILSGGFRRELAEIRDAQGPDRR